MGIKENIFNIMVMYNLHYTNEIKAKYKEVYGKSISGIHTYLNRLISDGFVIKNMTEKISKYYSVLNLNTIAILTLKDGLLKKEIENSIQHTFGDTIKNSVEEKMDQLKKTIEKDKKLFLNDLSKALKGTMSKIDNLKDNIEIDTNTNNDKKPGGMFI